MIMFSFIEYYLSKLIKKSRLKSVKNYRTHLIQKFDWAKISEKEYILLNSLIKNKLSALYNYYYITIMLSILIFYVVWFKHLVIIPTC